MKRLRNGSALERVGAVLVSLLLSISLLLFESPVGHPSAAIASSSGSSPFVGRLVDESDGVWGYQLLRPADWARSMGPDGQGSTYRSPLHPSYGVVNLVVHNLAIEVHPEGNDGYDVRWELFQRDGTIDGWTAGLERFMDSNQVAWTKVAAFDSGRIYFMDLGGRRALNAYVIDRGMPLALELIPSPETGPLPTEDELDRSGIMADFVTMAKSLRAVQTTPLSVQRSSEPKTLAPLSGPWYGDSGIQTFYPTGQGAYYNYRLEDTYYQSPPKVDQLYEWMYWSNYVNFTSVIARTNVTDDFSDACFYGGYSLVEHVVNAETTPTSGYASDNWWPSVYVAHLNTTTWHMMVFGLYGDQQYCKGYKPYTH